MIHRKLLTQSFSLRGALRIWYRSKMYKNVYYIEAVQHELARSLETN